MEKLSFAPKENGQNSGTPGLPWSRRRVYLAHKTQVTVGQHTLDVETFDNKTLYYRLATGNLVKLEERNWLRILKDLQERSGTVVK